MTFANKLSLETTIMYYCFRYTKGFIKFFINGEQRWSFRQIILPQSNLKVSNEIFGIF